MLYCHRYCDGHVGVELGRNPLVHPCLEEESPEHESEPHK